MNSNKNILIGGITGGIGSNIAKALSKEGYKIYGYSKNKDNLLLLNKELPELKTFHCDATDPSDLDKMYNSIDSEIDAYIHAIGSILIKPAHLTSIEDWNRTLNINLTSVFNNLKEVIPLMLRQQKGSIVLFSSTAANIGIPNHEAIAAAKGGVEALTKTLAASYSSKNIRFNCIAPGLTDTNMAKPITNNSKLLEISKKMAPLNDIAYPEDIASLASWLISDNAKFVTGQIIQFDGGLSTTVPKPKA